MMREGALPKWACAVVARRRKECSKERSLLAELLPTRLTGAGDEPGWNPCGKGNGTRACWDITRSWRQRGSGGWVLGKVCMAEGWIALNLSLWGG